MSSSSSWCTIESDPGVFTELIASIGVSGIQVEELYDLDVAHLSHLAPIHGLIFLFKWQSEAPPTADDVSDSATVHRTLAPHAEHVFFAKQIINNACATQAILNVLFNSPNVQLGTDLAEFKEFTLSLPPDVRGELIGASEVIRTAHNSFARADPFVNEEKQRADEEEEDAFHFIGYVPIDGVLYELDGLQSAPISLGPVGTDKDEWLRRACDAIQSRIDKYGAAEIRFNLLAIVKDRRNVYQEQLNSLQTKRAQLNEIVTSSTSDTAMIDINSDNNNHNNNNTNTTSNNNNTNHKDIQSELIQIDAEIRDISTLITDEKLKFERWSAENIRRKHNYLPFVYQLLRRLAQENKLQTLIQDAGKDTAERNERIKAAAAATAKSKRPSPITTANTKDTTTTAPSK